MKISIEFYDLLALDIQVARQASGQWLVRGVFPTFLGRPGRPHISLFTQPKRGAFRPHFTAFHGRSDCFREDLATLRPDILATWGKRLALEMVRDYAGSLEPTDLSALDQAGHTVHTVNWQAIHRWLRPMCRPGRALRITDRAILAFVCHVFRHWMRPTKLIGVDVRVPLLVIKGDGDESTKVRLLLHHPEGVYGPNAEGVVVQLRPPGWYLHTPQQPERSRFDKTVPFNKLERIAERVKQYLEQYPRYKQTSVPEDPPWYFGFICGCYVSDIIKLIVALSIEAAESRRSRLLPRRSA